MPQISSLTHKHIIYLREAKIKMHKGYFT